MAAVVQAALRGVLPAVEPVVGPAAGLVPAAEWQQVAGRTVVPVVGSLVLLVGLLVPPSVLPGPPVGLLGLPVDSTVEPVVQAVVEPVPRGAVGPRVGQGFAGSAVAEWVVVLVPAAAGLVPAAGLVVAAPAVGPAVEPVAAVLLRAAEQVAVLIGIVVLAVDGGVTDSPLVADFVGSWLAPFPCGYSPEDDRVPTRLTTVPRLACHLLIEFWGCCLHRLLDNGCWSASVIENHHFAHVGFINK